MARQSKWWNLRPASRSIRSPRTRHAIAAVPLLAWVGLGADGLSSSCYGPEEAFPALGAHTPLALFHGGGHRHHGLHHRRRLQPCHRTVPQRRGGYRVSTALLGPVPGRLGAALLVDYVLTVSTSLASGVDAFFSLLPVGAQGFKLATELLIVVLMTGLNFRGMKESIPS